MFEYLMPNLLFRMVPGSLLEGTCLAAVEHQIRYGRRQGVPWGISESGYYGFDAHRNYQYRAFGVPALGLKRGLEDDLVVDLLGYGGAHGPLVVPGHHVGGDAHRAQEDGGEADVPAGQIGIAAGALETLQAIDKKLS